eukprot:CAMPEP_0176011200 /NCGR_PEP_ID=MMETSP0120_2-20121206/5163_1 /TAXON_ID=160619 /ORGANISM="Kryptoperidinium foliaceum, Strain CCMP 1326" /LENGTH=331 /DNA_ID=CAMNT_0017344059 /DNA_START=102 /DNA_END=1098 /DNA_ORIENTATION=+
MSDVESSDGIQAQRAKAGFHFREEMAPGLVLEMELQEILHSRVSRYQQIDVIKTIFGKTLVTDGKTQSAQFDEYSYHESLVHPALLQFCYTSGKAPTKVFIGGGGELATAREVLRHSRIEKVVMVDLDEAVVDVCIEHLPEWGGEAVKNDARLVRIPAQLQRDIDIIILDISDPIEAGPGIMLYTKELYEHAASLLSPHGIFVTQAGLADAIPPPHANAGQKDTTCFGPIRNTLAEVFSCVLPYSQAVPSFGTDWGFVMASTSRGDGPRGITAQPSAIDDLIEAHITGGAGALRMYDGITHVRMFSLSKALRKQLAADTRVMTKDNPVFMY